MRLESGSQAAELRCVILTDFIRKAEMPKSTGEVAVCEDIGIVPIFEDLRRAALSDIRLGVLSGSLVIIPSSAEPLLRQAATALGIEPRDLSISPLSHDPGYSSVEIRGEYYRGSVRLITSVFQQGGITVLVGTKSLLGEGWDAPCINTLLARRKIWRVFREDYFAVPDAFARKKEVAQMFTQRWRRLVGAAELVYTRTPEGRSLLLRAHNHSLSGAFQKRAERVSCWK